MYNNAELLIIDNQQTGNLSNNEIIDLILENYHPKYRYVKSFQGDSKSIQAEIIIDSYPYAKESAFSYVTSTTLSLLLSQVSYVLFLNLILNYNVESLNRINVKKLLELRDRGNLLFTKNNFIFRKKINKNTKFVFNMRLVSSKDMKDFICCKIDFNVNGHLSGDAVVVAGPIQQLQ